MLSSCLVCGFLLFKFFYYRILIFWNVDWQSIQDSRFLHSAIHHILSFYRFSIVSTFYRFSFIACHTIIFMKPVSINFFSMTGLRASSTNTQVFQHGNTVYFQRFSLRNNIQLYNSVQKGREVLQNFCQTCSKWKLNFRILKFWMPLKNEPILVLYHISIPPVLWRF